MNDTIKLIIEMPTEMFQEMRDNDLINVKTLNKSIKAIENGIPLDDVKAEIKEKCDLINDSIASELSYPHHREIQELLCEIIASIGKAESEDINE